MKNKLFTKLFVIIPIAIISLAMVSCAPTPKDKETPFYNLKLNPIKKYSETELNNDFDILEIDTKYNLLWNQINFVKKNEDLDNFFRDIWSKEEKDFFKLQYQKILEKDFLQNNYLIIFNQTFHSTTRGLPIDGITFENDTIVINALDQVEINSITNENKAISELPSFIYVKKNENRNYTKFKWNVIKTYQEYLDYQSKLKSLNQ